MRDLRLLPKGHLHLHLELGMRPSTLADLAAKYGMEVPVIRGYGNFTAFSATCPATMATLRDRSDWERLADEICADGVNDGAVYLELALWAGQYVDIWGSLEATWDLVLDVFD